jgi:hypothetical protein
VDRADQPLRLSIVAEQLPRAFDPARYGTVADGSAAPDCRDQLILADKTVPILDEQEEQGKDLRLYREQAIVLAQFELSLVEYIFSEAVAHCRKTIA